jgi:hypothetical protein
MWRNSSWYCILVVPPSTQFKAQSQDKHSSFLLQPLFCSVTCSLSNQTGLLVVEGDTTENILPVYIEKKTKSVHPGGSAGIGPGKLQQKMKEFKEEKVLLTKMICTTV